jgi:hypothetical protein
VGDKPQDILRNIHRGHPLLLFVEGNSPDLYIQQVLGHGLFYHPNSSVRLLCNLHLLIVFEHLAERLKRWR